ncbi:MAG: GspH/FimT family pseudopilin [Rubrivivax sp.]|nr:GspH/FimT family pseudopilin [Rubrivivax sp.]
MSSLRRRGFTLVELMIAIALLALLMALAAPSFSTWIRNAQVRTMSQNLATGMRVAQSEAVRRNRQVVFFLTNAQPGLAATAAANGVNWVIRWIPMPGDTVTAAAPANEPFVQGGAISDVGGGVGITGPAAVCFNAQGRRVAATAAATGVTGAVCTVDADEPLASYVLERTGASRALRVTVSLGGQVRMCDPARTLSADAPDGCPA